MSHRLHIIRRDSVRMVVFRTQQGTGVFHLPAMHITMALCTKQQAIAMASQLEVIPRPVRGVKSVVTVTFGKQ